MPNSAGYQTYMIDNLKSYTPPRHTLTTNHALLPGSDVEGLFNVVRGKIEKGGEALPHYHELSKQFLHITAGSCMVSLGSEQIRLGAGDSVMIDVRVPHKVEVISEEPLELINIYTPALASDDIHEG